MDEKILHYWVGVRTHFSFCGYYDAETEPDIASIVEAYPHLFVSSFPVVEGDDDEDYIRYGYRFKPLSIYDCA